MRKSAFQKIIVMLCIAISILLVVCACTKDDPQDTTTTADSTTTADVSDTTDTDADETTEGSDATTDSTVTYKVTVVDADGAPLAGATVQLCVGDQCQLPVATDANGVATIELAKADYTVKVTLAGYTGEAEYTFATDATELTVQLTKDTEDATTEPEDASTEPEDTTTEPEETTTEPEETTTEPEETTTEPEETTTEPEETTTEPEETTTEPEETTTEPEETTTEPEETTTEPEDNNSETNPIYVDLQWNNANTMATATVTAPVGTTYYAVYAAGMLLTVNDDEPIELIASGSAINAPAIFKITNDGDEAAEYALMLTYPVGHKLNPEDTTLGFADVTLEKGDYDGYYYTYTAEGNGTVTFYISSITEGVTGNIVVRNNTTGAKSSLLANGVDNYGLELTVEVSEGDILSIQVVTEDIDGIMPAAEVSWYGSFAYPLGSEQNPIFPEFDENGTATVTVPANTTYYFASYNLSSEVTFTANGVEVEVTYGMMRMPSTFTLTNDTDEDVEYTLQITYPVGSQMNPEALFLLNYIAVNIPEGNDQGYYYKWTSASAGTLVLTCPVVEGVEYDVVLTNMTTYAMAWLSDSTDGTVSIDVAAGDEVIIQVVTLPDAEWNYPALETAIMGEFVLPVGDMSNPAALAIGENTAAIAAGNNQGYFFTYTAEVAGTLSLDISSDAAGWTYAVNNLTTSAYGDIQWSDSDPVVNPAIIEVAAGDKIQIMVSTYDPADSYNTPAGTVIVKAAFTAAE